MDRPDIGRDEQPISDRKDEILTSAARLFAKFGYAAVSIRALAQETHITPAALYHHFPNKAAIYVATLRYVFSKKAESVASVVKGNDAPEVKLGRLITRLTQLFSENPVMAQLLHRELLDGDNPRIKFLIEEMIAAPLREIQTLMQQLAPDRDTRISAVSVISLIMGFVELTPVLEHLTGQRNDRRNLSDFADIATQMVLHGLSMQPSAEGNH